MITIISVTAIALGLYATLIIALYLNVVFNKPSHTSGRGRKPKTRPPKPTPSPRPWNMPHPHIQPPSNRKVKEL